MDILDRIMQQVESLETLTSEASKVAEEGKAARELSSVLKSFTDKLTNLMVDYTEGEGDDAQTYKVLPEELLDVIGATASNTLQAALAETPGIMETLNKASGADRTDGDKLARALGMACEQSWIEGEARTRAESVVAAWNATAPKGKGSGSGAARTGDAKKDLPFPVRIKCESHDWSATQTGTKNSLKWAAVLHHEKEHGHKFGANDPTDQGVKSAIDAVVNGAAHAQGGGYLVDNAS